MLTRHHHARVRHGFVSIEAVSSTPHAHSNSRQLMDFVWLWRSKHCWMDSFDGFRPTKSPSTRCLQSKLTRALFVWDVKPIKWTLTATWLSLSTRPEVAISKAVSNQFNVQPRFKGPGDLGHVTESVHVAVEAVSTRRSVNASKSSGPLTPITWLQRWVLRRIHSLSFLQLGRLSGGIRRLPLPTMCRSQRRAHQREIPQGKLKHTH